MSEKSVSQIANERREKDHESSRKSLSPNKGKALNPNTNWGRDEQRRTSVGEEPNLGSNRNMGRKHESEDAPEQKPEGGFGYTKEQFERKHEQAPVVEKGALDNRRTVKSSATLGRHVQSDPGFKNAKRQNAAVVGNRNSTAKQFDARRKRSSSV
jgi:hypothetical protein